MSLRAEGEAISDQVRTWMETAAPALGLDPGGASLLVMTVKLGCSALC